MTRRACALIFCLLTPFTAGLAQVAGLLPASVPQGVYARVAVDDIYSQAVGIVGSADPATDAAPGTTPVSDADKVVLRYLKVLLDDPAVAGIAAAISWDSISASGSWGLSVECSGRRVSCCSPLEPQTPP
jgi:hypothetical protein